MNPKSTFRKPVQLLLALGLLLSSLAVATPALAGPPPEDIHSFEIPKSSGAGAQALSPKGPGGGSAAVLGNPSLWRGGRYDASDGLYVLGGRRYDPASGRGLQP